MIDFKMDGDINKILSRFEKKVEEGAKEGANDTAEQIYEKSQELVPVVTGELKSSGSVQNGKVKYTAGHAAGVHERPSSRGYKFLESAAKVVAPQAEKTVEQNIKKKANI